MTPAPHPKDPAFKCAMTCPNMRIINCYQFCKKYNKWLLSHTPASQPQERKTYEKCLHHFSCPNGEECWYFSQDYYWDCGEGATRLAKERVAIRNATLDDVARTIGSKMVTGGTTIKVRFTRKELLSMVESLRGEP